MAFRSIGSLATALLKKAKKRRAADRSQFADAGGGVTAKPHASGCEEMRFGLPLAPHLPVPGMAGGNPKRVPKSVPRRWLEQAGLLRHRSTS